MYLMDQLSTCLLSDIYVLKISHCQIFMNQIFMNLYDFFFLIQAITRFIIGIFRKIRPKFCNLFLTPELKAPHIFFMNQFGGRSLLPFVNYFYNPITTFDDILNITFFNYLFKKINQL